MATNQPHTKRDAGGDKASPKQDQAKKPAKDQSTAKGGKSGGSKK